MHKDNQAAFIEASNEIASNSSYQFVYLRQLLNMADTLEVIRVRSHFDYKYIPIFQRSENQLTNKKVLVSKIDHLVYTTATKIHQESRTELKTHKITRLDGSTFLTKPAPAQQFDAKQQDAAFEEACSRVQSSKPHPAL